jgi:hypothetical protein
MAIDKVVRVLKYFLIFHIVVMGTYSGSILVKIVTTGDDAIYSDFSNLYLGASIVKDGRGNELYDLDVQKEYDSKILDGKGREGDYSMLPFRNLAFTAVIFLPFTFFSFKSGYYLYVLLSLLLIIWSGSIFFERDKKKMIYYLVFCVGFSPFYYSFAWGQPVPLMLLALALYRLYRLKGSEFFSGFFATFILLKPHFALLLPFFMLLSKDKKRYLYGQILSLAVFFGISLIISGKGILNYLPFVFSTELPEYGSSLFFNHSIYPLFEIFSVPKILFYLINLVGYVASVSFIYYFNKKVPYMYSLYFSIFSVIIFGVHMLTQDPFFLMLPGVMLLPGLLKRIGKKELMMLTLMYFYYVLHKVTLFRIDGLASFFLLILYLFNIVFFVKEFGLKIPLFFHIKIKKPASNSNVRRGP